MNTKKKNKNKSYAIYDLQHSYLALLVIKLASVDRYFGVANAQKSGIFPGVEQMKFQWLLGSFPEF